MSPVISKARAAAESAGRTFLQAALPAAFLAWQAADHSLGQATLLAIGGAALAAGLAAVARVVKPIQTDTQGVGVEGLHS